MLEQQAGGVLRFDWESEVCYQPTSWAEFIEERPEEGLDFRVYMKADAHYAHEFSDKEAYRSLYLTVRGEEAYLFGYVPRGTDLEERIDKALRTGRGGPVPALLRLRFEPGSRGQRLVRVEEMRSPRWAYLEDPDWADPGGGNPAP